MATDVINYWPVNENSELVFTAGSGSTNITGFLSERLIPIDRASGKILAVGIGSGGGGSYTLPTATVSTLGGVKIDGTTVTITNGVISATQYALPTASTTVLGGVKVDGTTVTISNGVISAVSSGSSIPAPAAITASRNATSADNGGTLYSNLTTATTITVPSGLPAGWGVAIVQNNTGAVSVAAGSGVTINNASSFTKTGGQYSVISLIQTSLNNYILVGSGAV